MIAFAVNPNKYIEFKSDEQFKAPTTQAGREWLSTMWENVVNGKCEKTANPDAYGYVCNDNQMKAIKKREVQLITPEEQEEGVKGVAESVLQYYETRIEDIVLDAEEQDNLNIFKVLNAEMIREKRINLCACVAMAIRGDKLSLVKLKELIADEDCTYILAKAIRKCRGINITGKETVSEYARKRTLLCHEDNRTFSQYIKDILTIRSVGECLEGMM